MHQQRCRLPIADLTARVGRELEALARLSVALQRALSASGIDGALSPQIIQDLQSIDRITQSLEDLGAFVGMLSTKIPTNLDCEADGIFAALRLQDIAVSLDPRHPTEIQARDSDGDVSWF